MANHLTQKTIPYKGVPAFWAMKITGIDTITQPGGAAGAASRLKFDNIEKQAAVELAIPGNVEVKYMEITNADDSKIKFENVERHMSGLEVDDDGFTPKDITPTSEQSTKRGKVSLSINEADRDSDTWGEFVEKLEANLDAYWLIVIPFPFTYFGRNSANNADGFFYFVGKLSESINFETLPLSLVFETVVTPYATSAGWTSAVTGLDFTTATGEPGYIELKGIPSFHITPVALDSDDAAELKLGRVVAKKVTHA